MRKFIIDTDTGSDDAVALIMALREPTVKVEAITTVAGNCHLHYATANALASIEVAGTYRPKVYEGMDRPLLREAYRAESVHGVNGMSDMDLPSPMQTKEKMHAIDALIEYAKASDGELELISLGPATNLAMAIRKDPEAMKRYKRLFMMMGTGNGPGNVTPTAEFNAFADPEALKIVLDFDIPVTLIGWDASINGCYLDRNDLDEIRSLDNPISDFALDCNEALIQFNIDRMNSDGLDLPDPVAMAAVLYPEMITESGFYHADVEINSSLTYGTITTDFMKVLGKESNAEMVLRIDGNAFKYQLKTLLSL